MDTCPRCGGPLIEGQNIGPLFSAKLVKWDAHPVLSKPPMLRGFISRDGESRHDLTLHDQLIQRAAMGGPNERAALAHFEEIFTDAIANALLAKLREETATHDAGVRACVESGRHRHTDPQQRQSTGRVLSLSRFL